MFRDRSIGGRCSLFRTSVASVAAACYTMRHHHSLWESAGLSRQFGCVLRICVVSRERGVRGTRGGRCLLEWQHRGFKMSDLSPLFIFPISIPVAPPIVA